MNKILIVPAANFDFLLNCRIVTNNQLANLVSLTVVDYVSCNLVQIAPNSIVALKNQSSLTFSNSRDALSIFNRLQSRIFFVVPLVKSFYFFAIHN